MKLEQILVDEDLKNKDLASDNPEGFFMETFNFRNVKKGEVAFWYEPCLSLKVGLPPGCCWGLEVDRRTAEEALNNGFTADGCCIKCSEETKVCLNYTFRGVMKKYFPKFEKFLNVIMLDIDSKRVKKHELAHKAYFLRIGLDYYYKNRWDKGEDTVLTETVSRMIDGSDTGYFGHKDLFYEVLILDEILNHDRNLLLDIVTDFDSEEKLMLYIESLNPTKTHRRNAVRYGIAEWLYKLFSGN